MNIPENIRDCANYELCKIQDQLLSFNLINISNTNDKWLTIQELFWLYKFYDNVQSNNHKRALYYWKKLGDIEFRVINGINCSPLDVIPELIYLFYYCRVG